MRGRRSQWWGIRRLATAMTLFFAVSVTACQQRAQPADAVAELVPPTPTSVTAGGPIEAPRHFTNCAFRTGQNAIIGVPADVRLNGDFVLEPSDEIAVIAADGTVCAGAAVWSGANIAITVWGDDVQTEAIDGFLEDELLRFRLWDASENRERDAGQVTYTEGSDRYQIDGIYIVESMELTIP